MQLFCDAALNDEQTVKHKWTLVNADFVATVYLVGNMFYLADLPQLLNNVLVDLELAVHVLSSVRVGKPGWLKMR
ncbi:hypothetical protein T11_6308 [Trichinella zimbabwensis]|uniref:Uncharacterized protein n=1 Tax=Trichinella zimbabwensis TaxID=268475 RepID=A0A0V1HUG2_9BILA|nr:hypothetical protein T11_6308 [Trichinella zimbabwensis]